jgi:hypothetical protein
MKSQGKDAIIAGVYKTGEIWTDLGAIGPEMTSRLEARLRELGITLDVAKKIPFWRADRKMYVLTSGNVIPVVEAILDTLEAAQVATPTLRVVNHSHDRL